MEVTTAPKKEQRAALWEYCDLPKLALAAFSILYFADVCVRASEKYFWYDELFTLYFSRLPDWHSLWVALNRGIDFNPPLFYLVTQASNFLFGEGKISTRLPEILGFWIFSVSLFRFVRRRAGVSAAFAAMLLPMLTGVYFYAYEARPHALVLGACGLALVCWQMATETFSPRKGWLIGFSSSLFLAFMFHCFALTLLVPFSVAELFLVWRSRRIRWNMWLALLLPALVSLPVYFPLLSSYRMLNTNNAFAKFFAAQWTQVAHFYFFLFSPCILILFGMLLLFALDIFRRPRVVDERLSSVTVHDLVLGLAFLSLPLFGVILGKLINGPFFSRYFLSAVAGVCVVIGIGSGRRRKWTSVALALFLMSGVMFNFFYLLQHRVRGKGLRLVEPSTSYLLDTTPGPPLAGRPLLTAGKINLPVAVLNSFDFIYLVHYDSSLKNQLYFVAASQSEFAFSGFQRFLQYVPVKFNPPFTLREFSQEHSDFLVYGDAGQPEQVALLGQFGLPVKSLTVVGNHFLAHLNP